MAEQYSIAQFEEAIGSIKYFDEAVSHSENQTYIIEGMRYGRYERDIVDQFVLKALRGGIHGLYNELKDRGLQQEARKAIDDNPLSYY